jgi:hypothetical protein
MLIARTVLHRGTIGHCVWSFDLVEHNGELKDTTISEEVAFDKLMSLGTAEKKCDFAAAVERAARIKLFVSFRSSKVGRGSSCRCSRIHGNRDGEGSTTDVPASGLQI